MLNFNAPAFVPRMRALPASFFDDDVAEDNITPEELEELETTEEWVKTMALLDEMQREHLIEFSLRHAPSFKVAEIQKRFGVKGCPSNRFRKASPKAGMAPRVATA